MVLRLCARLVCTYISSRAYRPPFVSRNVRFFTHCTAQWCIFNNFSLDKHRHQIWDEFLFQFSKLKLQSGLAFCHKLPQKSIIGHLTSFLNSINSLSVKKNTYRILFVKPWLPQQPPETKLLISVASVRGQKFSL